VSRRVNTLFTGRTKLLERVKDAIRRDVSEQKIFVITGLGGLGKSEVCLKLAYELRQEYIYISPQLPSAAS
jgi:Mrp family chromosome partitioning ATPase